jgi:DHA1 family bicyclomycin/chloramphenicol resistance-like MFS transporter
VVRGGLRAQLGRSSALFGWLGGRSAEQWSITGTLAMGVLTVGSGATGLLAACLALVPLGVVIVSLFTIAGGVAISSPPATMLAAVSSSSGSAA